MRTKHTLLKSVLTNVSPEELIATPTSLEEVTANTREDATSIKEAAVDQPTACLIDTEHLIPVLKSLDTINIQPTAEPSCTRKLV